MDKTLYIAKFDKDEGVTECTMLGNYVPKGYTIVNTFFVDNSGFGRENEIALTFRQFLDKVKKDFGYAVKEIGQFQVYINEYVKL